MVLSYLEYLIPFPAPVPGIKLGFANIAVLVALYRFCGRSAMVVNTVRIVLSGLLFTGVASMLYALAGGIPAVCVMILLKRLGAFSIFGVSVGGAAVHVAGQLALASLIIQNGAVFMSFPVLLVAAVLSGLVIALISQILLRTIPQQP
jgi:heptaprenyl diphosphate synthase